jgi:branched-chain amino acid transport system permease protein
MQILLNGGVTGASLAALALAFTLVYLPCRVFHMALAAVYALAPFVLLFLRGAGLSWTLAIVGTLMVGAILSAAVELGNHAPLRRKQASNGAHLISSLGIYLVVSQLISITWGDEARSLRHSINDLITVSQVTISRSQAVEAVTCIGCLVAIGSLLSFTTIGLKLRALATNERQFAVEGNNVQRTRLTAFAFSGLLAAAVSLVSAYDVGFDPSTGLAVTLLAVVATVVGGRGSFAGPVVAAVGLGILRTAVTWMLSAQWQDAVTFALFTGALLFVPDGLVRLMRRDRNTV